MKLVALTTLNGRNVLVNMDKVDNVIECESEEGEEFSRICFVKRHIDVSESLLTIANRAKESNE